jgi:hypothetical protein
MASRRHGQVFPTTAVTLESLIPDPRLKLLDQLLEVMAQKHLPAGRQRAILQTNNGPGNQAISLETESP